MINLTDLSSGLISVISNVKSKGNLEFRQRLVEIFSDRVYVYDLQKMSGKKWICRNRHVKILAKVRRIVLP